jgi:hypothetical protein
MKIERRESCGSICNIYLAEIFYFLFALELILAYLYVLNLFNPSYFILIRGVIWTRDYEFKQLGQVFYGLLYLLVGALAISICLYKAGGFRAVKPSKLAVYVLAILTLVNLPPLIYWILYILDPHPLESFFRQYVWVSELDACIFHVYTSAYPLLLLATLYAWLLSSIGRAFKGHIRLKISCSKTLNTAGDCTPSDNVLIRRLGLASILLLSIILPIIPYLPSINPDFKPVSVDIRYYSIWLGNMLTADCWSAIEYAFYGESGYRPLYLLMLYTLAKLGAPKGVVLNLEALFISPLFTLAIFFLAKRLSGNDLYGLLASLTGILGFNMTVGMFTGSFTAWFALIPLYICIALTPDLEKGVKRNLAYCLISSIAIQYIHPWTWFILMAVLTLYLMGRLPNLFKKYYHQADKYLAIILAVNAIIYVLRATTTPIYETFLEYSLVSQRLGLEQLLHQASNLQRLSTTYVGGLFNNPLQMTLALIGILSFIKRGDNYSKLIMLWVAVISVIFPFSHLVIQYHLLLMTPFPILIAEGLWALSRLLARFDSKLPRLLQAFFITSSLTYTVRALCNLI